MDVLTVTFCTFINHLEVRAFFNWSSRMLFTNNESSTGLLNCGIVRDTPQVTEVTLFKLQVSIFFHEKSAS